MLTSVIVNGVDLAGSADKAAAEIEEVSPTNRVPSPLETVYMHPRPATPKHRATLQPICTHVRVVRVSTSVVEVAWVDEASSPLRLAQHHIMTAVRDRYRCSPIPAPLPAS